MRYSILIMVVLFACKGPKVVLYLNEDIDYSKYRTYYLLNLKSKGKASDDNIIPMLEEMIQSEMHRRNYVFDKDEPDLILRYELIANTETDIRVTGSPYNPPNYLSINTFNRSILLLELKDRKSEKLLWQASVDMQNHQDLRRRKNPIVAAVHEIFSTYFYKANSSEPDPSLTQYE
jgi:hypothetical protein